MSDYTKYELIDQYLTKKLSGKELEDFERKMLLDSEWNIMVQRQKLANQLLIEQRLLSAKDIILNHEVKTGNTNFKIWSIIAFSAVILTSTIYVLTQNYTENAEEKSSEIKVDTANILHVLNDKSIKNIKAKKLKIQSANKNIFDSAQTQQMIEPVFLNFNEVIQNTNKIDSIKVNTAKHENNTQTAKNDLCGESITAQINQTPTCSNQGTGSIEIHSVSGGASPYKYSIDGGETFHKGSTFGFLESKLYTIIIKDKNGCVSKNFKSHIEIKNCDNAKEYVFNPYIGETWTFPVEDKKQFKIAIINREGRLVFQSVISNGFPAAWDGKDMSNGFSEVGLHYFVIEFEDGSVKEGYVSIIM